MKLGSGAWVALTAAVLTLTLLAVPLRVTVLARRQPGDWGETVIYVTWLGLTVWRSLYPHETIWAAFRQRIRERRVGLDPTHGSHTSAPGDRPRRAVESAASRHAVGYLYRQARVVRWRLLLKVGTGDAALTARLAGLLQAAIGVGLAWLSRQPPFAGLRPHALVLPDFQRPGLQVDLTCIVAVWPAHIICASAIYAGAIAAARWQHAPLSRRRGGRQRWPSIPFRV